MTGKLEFRGLQKALRLYKYNKLDEAEAVCTEMLRKNPLDQAAWIIKLQCLTDSAYVDELENEDVGISEAFLETNTISKTARPGTSFLKPLTAKGMNPILRPTTNSGRPISGVVRPMSSLKTGTMDQALRTARTAKTARAVSSTSARNMRLGTASMIGSEGLFVNFARLNLQKYGTDKQVNRQLFEYAFYHENDVKIALQIASLAVKTAPDDWYWKNQLGKCYFRIGMLSDAEKNLLGSLKHNRNVENFCMVAKVYKRQDEPVTCMKVLEDGLAQYPNDVTLITALARTKELLGDYEGSLKQYKKILQLQSNNIEAIACVATHFFYDNKPEVALTFYRRILQMGVNTAEVFMNMALCCLACQQFDLALQCATRAQSVVTEDVAADIWYNTGQLLLQIGASEHAGYAFKLCLSVDADYGEAMINLGILKQREGKLSEARSLYASATSKCPHLFEGHFNLALIAHHEGKYDESKKLLEKGLEIFPTHEPSLQLHKTIMHMYTSV